MVYPRTRRNVSVDNAGDIPRHIRYIPAFLALIALLLSLYGFRCNFVQFVSKVNGPDGPISIHFGYWSHQSWTVSNSTNGLATEKTCEWYPVDATAPDKTFKVGRTFNLFALVLGASFILLDILSGCVSTAPNRGILQAGAIGYLLCCLCSGLSLLILQSDVCTDNVLLNPIPGFQGTTCSLSTGGKSIIAATVMWFVAGCGIVAIHRWHETKRGSKDEYQGLDELLVNEEPEDVFIHSTVL
ncbi:hypothetical protein ACHAWX_005809 [Stephanocyclus meneghinianus]